MRLIRNPMSSVRRSGKTRLPSWQIIFALLLIPVAWCLYDVSLLNVAIGLACVIGLTLCIVAYQLIRARVRLALLRNESSDLALARKSAGLEGGVIRRAPMTLWLSGPKDWAPLVLDQFEEARTRFEAMLGEPVAVEYPLRFLLFADQACFLEYARGARFVLPSGEHGFYLADTPGKIGVGMPNSLKRLVQPERLFRTVFGYYLLHGLKGFFPHPWLNVGVAWLVAREPAAGAEARVNRKVLPAALGQRPALNARMLFRPTPKITFQPKKKRGGHAEFADGARMVFHVQSLIEFLAGEGAPLERKEPFRAFLKDLQRRDKYDTVFRRHFSYGLDQLYNNWREWVIAKGIGDHEPPPAAIRQALLDHVIPLVADRYAVPEDRIQAIRDMGQAGYTLGADTLIDLLRDRDREVRATAVWALEAISGTAGGEDIAHWEDWWDELPHEVEPAGLDDQVSPTDQRLYRKES